MQAVDNVSRHLKPGEIAIIGKTVPVGVTRTMEGMTHCGAFVEISSDQLLSDFKKRSIMWQNLDPSVLNEGKPPIKETASGMPILATVSNVAVSPRNSCVGCQLLREKHIMQEDPKTGPYSSSCETLTRINMNPNRHR